ncbi:MAG: exodeoxyribonuclease VII large subunit [Rikenellaceae bacterium]|nr:exodeoxyribonuclease VII large subunit [Rikenellaceae bacterium]
MNDTPHITLAQLQGRISIALAEALPLPVWVSAEVADIKINASGHCYIELIEKNEKTGATEAQARATIWRSQVMSTIGRFEQESGQRLAKGMKILFKATVSHHTVYGMSLQIQQIDALHTIGDMERRRQQTIEQLQKEGVWEQNRSLPMPLVVQRVAVISSATAAGYRDFMKELEHSAYRIETELFEATMQGERCDESIVAALYAVAERSDEFDAVAIIRGGGSTGDLECYNSYLLAFAVTQFPLPVLTGIGHDKDTSVTDMVAHTPLKTPTAVAAWIDGRAADFDGALEYCAISLRDICRQATHAAALRLEQFSADVRHLAERTLQSEKQRLEGIATVVANFAPERIFRLGYAIARREGKALQSVEGVNVGDTIDISLADGDISAKVLTSQTIK